MFRRFSSVKKFGVDYSKKNFPVLPPRTVMVPKAIWTVLENDGYSRELQVVRDDKQQVQVVNRLEKEEYPALLAKWYEHEFKDIVRCEIAFSEFRLKVPWNIKTRFHWTVPDANGMIHGVSKQLLLDEIKSQLEKSEDRLF